MERVSYPATLTTSWTVVFACRSNLGLNFRCVVVNTQHSDHRKYNDGDAYVGLEKYIFVHLLGYARRQHVASKAQFCVTLDKLKDKHTFDVLKRALNGRARKELNRTYNMFTGVIGVDSHAQALVQAADVLAGCVAWVWNKHYEKTSDPDRIALAHKIAKYANLRLTDRARSAGVQRGHYLNFAYPTWPHQENGFAIWEMYLWKDKEAEARAQGAEQLACFPAQTTFADLRAMRFRVEMRCVRCDRKQPNLLQANPAFGRRLLSDSFRPKCQVCGKRGVLLLRPDPRRPKAIT